MHSVSKHVFLSYIHEDKEQVDDLQDTLEAAGFDVRRDEDQLFPGDNWELKIRQAIQGGTSSSSPASPEHPSAKLPSASATTPGVSWPATPTSWDEGQRRAHAHNSLTLKPEN